MVLISEAVKRSALARRESCGAHSRIDYPNYDRHLEQQNNNHLQTRRPMTLEQRR